MIGCCFFPTGLGFTLKGVMIPNHSALERNPSVIGTDEDALHCMTDNPNCCVGGGSGDWFFPRGNVFVPITAPGVGLWYISRRTQALLMNYRGDGSGGVTGLFLCEIQGSGDILHKFYTCIYDGTSTTDCKILAIYRELLCTDIHA